MNNNIMHSNYYYVGIEMETEDLIRSCLFCESGKYSVLFEPSTDPKVIENVGNLGLRVFSKNDWFILICDTCGNLQFFRSDLSKD